MNRLWVKLALAFLAISLAAIGVVAVTAARATGEQFRRYIVASGQAGQPAWSEALIAYYLARGSWDGVDRVLTELGPGTGRGRGANSGGPNLAVVDLTGRVVASRTGELVGEVLPQSLLDQGTPLILDDRPIGMLLNVRLADVVLDAEGRAFLDQVGASLIWAALLAAALSLVLGVVVSRMLTAPLGRLTTAAQAIAGGDLAQHVTVDRRDEIGQLGEAFNAMAASLAAAETQRQNLIADVSHELRTPLTVIQGDLQAILDGVYPLEIAQVATLYDETRLLTRLVDDLHTLALADAGQLRLDVHLTDVAGLAETAVGQFMPVAEAADIQLALVVDAGDHHVEGDADRLAQVLRNLLSNALRHTAAGGRVAVSVARTDHQVVLQVTDTGEGIAPEDLPHVFERFYRGDRRLSARRAGSGAGLGLAIAQQIIAGHGGQIRAASPAAGGATFVITLPAHG